MMRNVSPTHLKILHVQAEKAADADALAESAFNAWSKDHPGVAICQVEYARAFAPDPGAGVWTVSITVMYDLVHEGDAVAMLMHDLDTAMGAWESWVKMAAQAQEENKAPTIIDMQIVLAQPLAKLYNSFMRFRKW